MTKSINSINFDFDSVLVDGENFTYHFGQSFFVSIIMIKISRFTKFEKKYQASYYFLIKIFY